MRPITRFGLLIAGAVLVLDQVSKAWILHGLNLPARGSIEILPFFYMTMVWNKGVSFGFLSADSPIGKYALILFSLAVVAYLLSWLRSAENRIKALGIGMIVGGAIGNVIDRLVHGAVADFLDFGRLFFPWVFNIADAGISIGVAVLAAEMLLGGSGKANQTKPEQSVPETTDKTGHS